LPNIKAAEKWSRQSEKRTTRNKDVTSRLKTVFKKAISAGDAATASAAERAFDKAASKGIIHPNKAARKKARLAKAIVRAASAPIKPAKARAAKKPSAKKASKK